MRRIINRSGQVFSRVTVLDEKIRKNHKTYWLCKCICGNTKYIDIACLISGGTKSCGCLGNESRMKKRTRKIGRGTSAYNRWVCMIQRCKNPKNKSFHNYGGRGISVCRRWMTFDNFYLDMGDPPPGTSLDRIDNNGDYNPSNCQWSDVHAQQNNRRNNRMMTVNGTTKTFAQWVDGDILRRARIEYRLRHGWTVEKAINTPSMKHVTTEL